MTSSAIVKPIISQIEAQLYVRDIPAALAFYADKLGFDTVLTYGEPPFYAQIRRDNARINLRLISEPVFAGDIREREHLLSASMTLESAGALKQLFLDLQAAGVAFHQTLKSEPWDARTFIVRDPDGHLLLFSSPASS